MKDRGSRDTVKPTTQPNSASSKASSCAHDLTTLVSAYMVSLIGDISCTLHSLEILRFDIISYYQQNIMY